MYEQSLESIKNISKGIVILEHVTDIEFIGFEIIKQKKYGDKFTNEDGSLTITNAAALSYYIGLKETYLQEEKVNLDSYNKMLVLEKYDEIRETDSFKNFDINTYYNQISANSLVDYRNWGKVNGLGEEINTILSPVDFIKEVMNKEDIDLYSVMSYVNGTLGVNEGINCGVSSLALDGAHSDAFYLTNMMRADEYIPGLIDMYDYLYYNQHNILQPT